MIARRVGVLVARLGEPCAALFRGPALLVAGPVPLLAAGLAGGAQLPLLQPIGEVASLAGLSKLVSIMEVYIGNNRLAQLKEVQQLKD